MMTTSGATRRASSARRMLGVCARRWRAAREAAAGALCVRVLIGGAFLQPVTETANAAYGDPCAGELVAQAAHVNFERVRRRLGLRRKHRIEKRLLAHDPARPGEEHVED